MMLEVVKKAQEKPTAAIPWAYDLYEIQVDGVAVGHMVYRYGTNSQLYYCGHIGYSIDEEYRHKGYGTLALQKLCAILKAQGVTLVTITCRKNNVFSQKMIEKLNVVHRELLRDVSDPEYAYPEGLYRYEVRL